MTRYDFFRRRIAPVAFLLVMGLIAYDTCDKQDRSRATIAIDFGAAAPRVTSVEAELVTLDGEPIGTLRRVAPAGMSIGPTRFETALPSPDAELRLDIALGAEHRKLVRRIHAEDGATVTVSVGDDLR